MIRWLERNGYDVSYFTGVDTDRRGARAPRAPARSCRSGTTSTGPATSAPTSRRRATPASTSPSSAATRCSGRRAGSRRRPTATLVTYKETHANAKIDPLAERLDRHLARSALQPARRRRPARERADRHDLHGQLRHATRSTVPAADGRLRLWRNTAAASLPAGETRDARPTARSATSGTRISTTAPGPPAWCACPRPTATGVADASSTTASSYGPGTATHHLTLYRDPNGAGGALVFGAGTVQWSWGLDDNHDRGSEPPERRHAAGDGQPVRRHGRRSRRRCSPAWCRRARRPTRSPPTATITAPATTASSPTPPTRRDHRDGDRHAAAAWSARVEVSVDGGATWHPADGPRARGRYTWIADASRATVTAARARRRRQRQPRAGAPRSSSRASGWRRAPRRPARRSRRGRTRRRRPRRLDVGPRRVRVARGGHVQLRVRLPTARVDCRRPPAPAAARAAGSPSAQRTFTVERGGHAAPSTRAARSRRRARERSPGKSLAARDRPWPHAPGNRTTAHRQIRLPPTTPRRSRGS